MTDLDTIRERHRKARAQSPGAWLVCLDCTQRWPCDTRVVLDALDREREAWMGTQSDRAARDAARADADRLAEALTSAIIPPSYYCWCGARDGGHSDECAAAMEALRQHDEATR